jgi:hypothetical protein
MRRKAVWSIVVALAAAGCGGAVRGAPVGSAPTPAPVPMRAVAILVHAASGAPVAGARCGLHVGSGFTPAAPSTADGYVLWPAIPTTQRPTDVQCEADGYAPFLEHRDLVTDHNEDLAPDVVLQPLHVDPSRRTFEQLAAVRGAMWPMAGFAGLPYGPRPGDASNIISTTSWNCYTRGQRDQIAAELHRRGYTHVVYGPFAPSASYHGQYCDPTADWSVFLDDLQDLWDRGFTPIVFLHPDGWTLAETTSYYTSRLADPRAQRLLRVVVPSGWEPAGYNWSSCTWAGYIAWARQQLPTALVLMHNQAKPDGAPYDAPVGTDALCDDNGKPNGDGWRRVFDAGLDGWLIQTGPATMAPAAAPNRREWCAMFATDGDGALYHSVAWHFAHAIMGFPSLTARGRKFLLIDGEGTAYAKYWGHLSEADAEAWGDEAMRCGADGYLDGGTAAVGVR